LVLEATTTQVNHNGDGETRQYWHWGALPWSEVIGRPSLPVTQIFDQQIQQIQHDSKLSLFS